MLNKALFWIQMGLMAAFGWFQLEKLATSDKGTSLTWILCWQGFVFINLLLTLRSWRNKPDSDKVRLVAVYCGWAMVGIVWFSVMLYKGTASWNNFDNFNLGFCILGTIAAFVYGHRRGLNGITPILADARVRGLLAVIYKSVPQTTMAAQLLLGVPVLVAGLTVCIGHITVLLRVIQTLLALRKDSKDTDLIATVSSEIANEISWLIFTIVWFLY